MSKSKEWFWSLIDLFLAILIITGLFSIKAINRYEDSLAATRTISIGAEGKITAVPDIAVVSFSEVTEGKDPEKIADENNKKINAAIDLVKEEGIDAKDIKTTAYNLYPLYEYDEDKRATFISGYTLTQTIQLKIRDFSKIGKILGALPTLGINQIGTLSFDVDDQDKYLNDARKIAFEKAFAKAREMAKQNKVHIKRVVTFNESQGGYLYPIYRESSIGVASSAAKSPQIEAGSQEITVNVSVTYEIE